MKGIVKLLMALTAVIPLGSKAQGVADIAKALMSTGCYKAEARVDVTLPQTDADIEYTLRLTSMATVADTLAPASYLIEWSLPTPSGVAEGFTAYFDGNLYRFRDARLQEYHTEWDATPFRLSLPGRGVQNSTQFAELLPQYIGYELKQIMGKEEYDIKVIPETVRNGRKALEIKSVMTVQDNVVQERRYFLDPVSYLPLEIVTESSPGAISEQTITVKYTTESEPQCSPLSEEMLVESYPEVFEKYRVSNFRIENLRDTPMPAFALPTLTGERHTHHRGDRFARPTMIAIIDPAATSFNAEFIQALRSAADLSSRPADLILAFTTTNVDLAEQTAGAPRPGETMLLNARSLVRDCGATDLPVVIVADTAGNVRNVVLGFNKNLSEIVLQSLELL